ncbi:MAG: PAS domain-containing protein, partial [bacterium]
YEHKALKKDGCIFPVEVRGKCISSHGRKMRITAIRDISEHKEAEEALRRSEATNKAFLSAIPDLMFRISKDGTCLDFKAAKDIETLIPPNEFLGKNILEMLPSDVVRKCSKYIELVLKTGETQIFEYQLPIRDQMRDYELQ